MNKVFVFTLIFLLMFLFVTSEVQVGIEDDAQGIGINLIPDIPTNYSILSVNSSLYWDTEDRGALKRVDEIRHNWLESNSLFWSNAGHTMDTELDMNNNDITEVNLINGTYLNMTNGTFKYLNVTEDLFVKNSTIFLGDVAISSSFDPGIGRYVVNFNESFVNATGYFGDGGFLDNISFVNGTVIAIAFNGTNFYGGNFTGDNFTGLNFFGGNFYGTYDWTAEYPWLYFNGTFLEFNDTYFNTKFNQSLGNFTNLTLENLIVNNSITLNGTTINDWSEVNYTVGNDTVIYSTPSITGSYSVILPETFNFEIAQIIVVPSLTNKDYRFGMYEVGSGETIDANLIKHKGTWNIFKSYPINAKVSLNFTNVDTTNNFTVTIKYFTNVAN